MVFDISEIISKCIKAQNDNERQKIVKSYHKEKFNLRDIQSILNTITQEKYKIEIFSILLKSILPNQKLSEYTCILARFQTNINRLKALQYIKYISFTENKNFYKIVDVFEQKQTNCVEFIIAYIDSLTDYPIETKFNEILLCLRSINNLNSSWVVNVLKQLIIPNIQIPNIMEWLYLILDEEIRSQFIVTHINNMKSINIIQLKESFLNNQIWKSLAKVLNFQDSTTENDTTRDSTQENDSAQDSTRENNIQRSTENNIQHLESKDDIYHLDFSGSIVVKTADNQLTISSNSESFSGVELSITNKGVETNFGRNHKKPIKILYLDSQGYTVEHGNITIIDRNIIELKLYSMAHTQNYKIIHSPEYQKELKFPLPKLISTHLQGTNISELNATPLERYIKEIDKRSSPQTETHISTPNTTLVKKHSKDIYKQPLKGIQIFSLNYRGIKQTHLNGLILYEPGIYYLDMSKSIQIINHDGVITVSENTISDIHGTYMTTIEYTNLSLIYGGVCSGKILQLNENNVVGSYLKNTNGLSINIGNKSYIFNNELFENKSQDYLLLDMFELNPTTTKYKLNLSYSVQIDIQYESIVVSSNPLILKGFKQTRHNNTSTLLISPHVTLNTNLMYISNDGQELTCGTVSVLNNQIYIDISGTIYEIQHHF